MATKEDEIVVMAYDYQPHADHPRKRRTPKEAFDQLLLGRPARRRCREDDEARQEVVLRREAFRASFQLQVKEQERLQQSRQQDREEIDNLKVSVSEKDAELETLRGVLQRATEQHAAERDGWQRDISAAMSQAEGVFSRETAALSQNIESLRGENQVLLDEVALLTAQLGEKQRETESLAQQKAQAEEETLRVKELADGLHQNLQTAAEELERERSRPSLVDASEAMDLKEANALLQAALDGRIFEIDICGQRLDMANQRIQELSDAADFYQREAFTHDERAMELAAENRALRQQKAQQHHISEDLDGFGFEEFVERQESDAQDAQASLDGGWAEMLLWNNEMDTVHFYYRRPDGYHRLVVGKDDISRSQGGKILPHTAMDAKNAVAERVLKCCFAQMPEAQLDAARLVAEKNPSLDGSKFMRRLEEKMVGEFGRSARARAMRTQHAEIWARAVGELAAMTAFQNSCISFIRGCRSVTRMSGCWPAQYADAYTQACSQPGPQWAQMAEEYFTMYANALCTGKEIDDARIEAKLAKAFTNTRSGIGKRDEEVEAQSDASNPWLAGWNPNRQR